MATPLVSSATLNAAGDEVTIVWSVQAVTVNNGVTVNATRGVNLSYAHKSTAGGTTVFLIESGDVPRQGEPITVTIPAGTVTAVIGGQTNPASVVQVTNLSTVQAQGRTPRTYRTEERRSAVYGWR
jgi:hypothetical protein